jgi:hypothetical protein
LTLSINLYENFLAAICYSTRGCLYRTQASSFNFYFYYFWCVCLEKVNQLSQAPRPPTYVTFFSLTKSNCQRIWRLFLLEDACRALFCRRSSATLDFNPILLGKVGSISMPSFQHKCALEGSNIVVAVIVFMENSQFRSHTAFANFISFWVLYRNSFMSFARSLARINLQLS